MTLDELINAALERQGWKAEADVARALDVERVRLYQWKTHRRRCPNRQLIALAALAERDSVAVLGQYAHEWEAVKRNPELMGSR